MSRITLLKLSHSTKSSGFAIEINQKNARNAFPGQFENIVKSYLLSFVTVSICFVVTEQLFRWHIFAQHAWSIRELRSTRDFGESGMAQASKFQDVLWELKPNLHEYNKFVLVETNAEGLRDKTYSHEKPKGVYRVAVVGDSFTMPEGVAIEDAYHSLIENQLNQEGLGRKFEFINFGVAGYSLPQYIATIKHKVLDYHPDMILIGFCAANDSEKPNFEVFNKPFQPKPVSDPLIKRQFFEQVGDLYKYIYTELRGRVPGYKSDAAYVDEEFEKLSASVSEAKIPIVIAYLDNRMASLDYSMVESSSKRFGFTFIDGTTGFSGDVDPQHILYKTDWHPNAAAHKIIAASVLHGLRDKFPKLFGRMLKANPIP